MKYLKHYNESNSIAEICELYDIKNWSLVDGLVNVAGGVFLKNKKLRKLPLKFGNVSGNFDCSWNILTSLEGAPKQVDNDFNCGNNILTSLESSPDYVGKYFNCNDNKLTTLKYGPNQVGRTYDCSFNKLTSLEGMPYHINYFNCLSNNLYDVYDFIGEFNIGFNPVQQIYKYITTNEKLVVSIDYFKDCKILIGRDIHINKFKTFLDEYGLKSNVDIYKLIEAGYIII